MLLMRKWQRSQEKSTQLRKDLFCLELVKLCGYSWMHSVDVYGDFSTCVFVVIGLSAIHLYYSILASGLEQTQSFVIKRKDGSSFSN